MPRHFSPLFYAVFIIDIAATPPLLAFSISPVYAIIAATLSPLIIYAITLIITFSMMIFTPSGLFFFCCRFTPRAYAMPLALITRCHAMPHFMLFTPRRHADASALMLRCVAAYRCHWLSRAILPRCCRDVMLRRVSSARLTLNDVTLCRLCCCVHLMPI